MLAGALVILYFLFLGAAPLASPDEGRYAEIAREMVASGDWVTPRLNGVAYFEKPPLVYWSVAICYKLLGASEWSMRITPALFALGGVAFTYFAARKFFGHLAGLLAGMVLGSSAFYFALGRILLLDMVVSVLISSTLFFFILGVRETRAHRRRKFFYGLYLSAALATLSKGLIGFLLPGAVMFVWLLVFCQWRRLRPLYLPSGLLLFLIVTVPWHVLAADRNPSWAHFYFVHEHWERFTTTAHSRVQPWWFFLPVVLFGLFPWAGFLGAVPATLRGWSQRRENADVWFFVVWAGFIFLFFSASQSKLPPYVLPVFPPLAVLMGAGLARSISERVSPCVKAGFIVFSFLSVLLTAALVFVVLRPAIARIDAGQALALQPFAFAMAGSLFAGSLCTLWLFRKGRVVPAIIGLLTATGLFFATLAVAAEKIQRAGTRELARYVTARLPPDAPLFHYHDFFHDFVFYSRRFVGTVEYHGDELELVNDPIARGSGRFIDEDAFRKRWQSPERIYVVVRKKKLRDLRRDYDAQSLKQKEAARGAVPLIDSLPLPSVLIDPISNFHVVRETADHYLFSNRDS
ncbi:MAG: glycosyltransferase family 39 protein [Opitutaceae bacterium]|nr:glycosyltransferase family 39 protein [Opitutaceae bacterium]